MDERKRKVVMMPKQEKTDCSYKGTGWCSVRSAMAAKAAMLVNEKNKGGGLNKSKTPEGAAGCY